MQAARPLLTFFLFLSIWSCACHSSPVKEEVKTVVQPAAVQALYKPDSSAQYTGVFAGKFGDEGIITLVLNYISGKTVSGYDVQGRPAKCEWRNDAGGR